MTEAWKMLLCAWMIWLIIVGWSLTAPQSSSSVQLFSSLSSLLGTRQSREDLKMLRRDSDELKWTLPDRICYTYSTESHRMPNRTRSDASSQIRGIWEEGFFVKYMPTIGLNHYRPIFLLSWAMMLLPHRWKKKTASRRQTQKCVG